MIFLCFIGAGWYIYFETSSPVRNFGEAVFESATIKANAPARCMKFRYHMYGADMGELRLDMVSDSIHFRKDLFYNYRSENTWKEATVRLPDASFDYKVTFTNIL